jgi:hypothetical protein
MTCSRAIVIHRGRIAADVDLAGEASGASLEDTFLRATALEVEA